MELLARVVGPEGQVFAQNNKFVLERFAEAPLSERLAKPILKNVVRVDREFDDPLLDEIDRPHQGGNPSNRLRETDKSLLLTLLDEFVSQAVQILWGNRLRSGQHCRREYRRCGVD
jgi:hypothetical protein